MNFKPTVNKIAESIIFWVILNVPFWYHESKSACVCEIGRKCICHPNFKYAIIQTFTNPLSWISLIAIYLVLSLLQLGPAEK